MFYSYVNLPEGRGNKWTWGLAIGGVWWAWLAKSPHEQRKHGEQRHEVVPYFHVNAHTTLCTLNDWLLSTTTTYCTLLHDVHIMQYGWLWTDQDITCRYMPLAETAETASRCRYQDHVLLPWLLSRFLHIRVGRKVEYPSVLLTVPLLFHASPKTPGFMNWGTEDLVL